MNKIFILSFAFCLLFSFSSCKHKEKTRAELIEEFRSELTAQDTTQMLSICDNAMAMLKAKEYDKVLESMYEYIDSTKEVKPLSKELSQRYKKRFMLFPVMDYERKYYSFQLEGCNDVKYEVTFATADQAGTKEPAKTAYMFNPVKVDGSWKLCVKTADEMLDMLKR